MQVFSSSIISKWRNSSFTMSKDYTLCKPFQTNTDFVCCRSLSICGNSGKQSDFEAQTLCCSKHMLLYLMISSGFCNAKLSIPHNPCTCASDLFICHEKRTRSFLCVNFMEEGSLNILPCAIFSFLLLKKTLKHMTWPHCTCADQWEHAYNCG